MSMSGEDTRSPERESDRRRALLEATVEAYAALHADPAAWAEEQDDLAAWDVTLNDGIDDE